MRLFRTWDRQRVVDAIDQLESQAVSGAATLSMNGGGAVTLRSSFEINQYLDSLYRRLDEIDRTNSGRSRVVRVIGVKGY